MKNQLKTQFLVQKAYQDEEYIFNCSMLLGIVSAKTESEATELLEKELNIFLNTEAKQYVKSFMSSESVNKEIITCPEGRVILPVDVWHCKFDGKACPIQASIQLNDNKNFMLHCRAENKEEIFNTVEKKKYQGFHHVPGRYLCPSCDKLLKNSKENFKYHYPWELYPLWKMIDFKDTKIMSSLYSSDIPLSVKHSKVCASCFVEIMKKLFPNNIYASSLFAKKLDFFPR